jgi:predicted RNA-binding Zn ribbon-like protein
MGHFDHEFELTAGVLCLDFANTVSKRKIPGRTEDELANYGDLVMFAKQSRMLSPQAARELLAAGLVERGKAAQVLGAAVVLREAIYRIFSSVATGHPAVVKDIKLINDFVEEAMRHRRIVSSGRGYRWEWKRNEADYLAQILWPIALSAAELLTASKLSGVRECGADDCAWLFLDESRNHSRRWCDMKVCGNRQKARRHYQRVRQ